MFGSAQVQRELCILMLAALGTAATWQMRWLMVIGLRMKPSWRELKTVYLVLCSFASKVAGQTVKWFTDNQAHYFSRPLLCTDGR